MAATAGVVQYFEVHQGLALLAGAGQGLVHGGFDQRLRKRGWCVVAGRCFARVAGALQVHVALLHTDFPQGLETFFFADKCGVVGIEVGFYGLALGGGAFVLQVHGTFYCFFKPKFQQAFVDATQVGDAHVFEVPPRVKQRGAPVGFVQQLFEYLAQGGVVKNLGPQQQRRTLRIEEATVEEWDVDVFRTFVQHFKQLLQCVHAVMQLGCSIWRGGQAVENVSQAVASVKRVPCQKFVVFVLEIHHEQQPEQQHHAVFVHAGHAGFGVRTMNGAPHGFKQRVLTSVAVNNSFEVFFDFQSEIGRRSNRLLDGTDLTGLCGRDVGIASKEEGKQSQGLCLLGAILKCTDGFQIKLDVRLFCSDFVGVVHAPDSAIGEEAKPHAQCAQVVLQLMVRVVGAISLARVECFAPGFGLADGCD